MIRLREGDVPLGDFCNEVKGFLNALIFQVGTGFDLLVVCITIKPENVVGIFRCDGD